MSSERAARLRRLLEQLGLEKFNELQIQAARHRPIPERLLRRLAQPTDARLTPREREVIVLVASGFTNQEIADELGCSRETVKTHLGKLYAKLGVHNRMEAVNAFLESG